MFVEPKIQDIKISKELGAKCVELHTGNFCNMFNKKKKLNKSYLRLKNAANFAKKVGLEVHAGHGLTCKSTMLVSKIDQIVEFNIGHAIIADAVFFGLKNTIRKFKKIISK